jgi:hypothetical protein
MGAACEPPFLLPSDRRAGFGKDVVARGIDIGGDPGADGDFLLAVDGDGQRLLVRRGGVEHRGSAQLLHEIDRDVGETHAGAFRDRRICAARWTRTSISLRGTRAVSRPKARFWYTDMCG